MVWKTSNVRIALLFVAVLFQLGVLNVKKFAVNADEDAEASEESSDPQKAEDTDDKKKEEEDKKEPDSPPGDSPPEGDCLGAYYREYCPEERPCCLYNKGTHMCQAAKGEGENCTQNAFAYNTGDCFCKQGLFCVDHKCTSTVPPKKVEELY